MASSAVYPYKRSALAFQMVMVPSGVAAVMASREELTMARKMASVSSVFLRGLIDALTINGRIYRIAAKCKEFRRGLSATHHSCFCRQEDEQRYAMPRI
jgi:hypothetical protein